MTPPAPRAIVFDWDNTLVDTWHQLHHVINHTLEAMGHPPWSFEQAKRRIRTSARESFPSLFGDGASRAMEIFFAAFEAQHLRRLTELPGAGAALRELSDAGLLLTVVSNKDGAILRREAAHLGWESLFHRLVGAADAARDKPAAEPVIMALAESGIEPGPDVWLVGDTETDMLCARNTGCLPVLLRHGGALGGEFDGAEPALQVESCRALVELALNP